MKDGDRILALNGGSSSLKFGLYRWTGDGPQAEATGEAEGIGASPTSQGSLRIRDADGSTLHEAQHSFSDVACASQAGVEQLGPRLNGLAAVAHRIVHGGPEVVEHQVLTPAVRAKLEAAKDFAPLHVPPALAVVDATTARFPGVPEIACLDTAFHRTLPERARRFALPADVLAGGVHRYGAHGLSLESVVRRLGPALKPRCVIAHLGGGCSVTAVQNGRSVDTTMGLTPTGGMMMGTRTGDLDPGVLIYLLRHRGFTADSLEDLVDRRSGLLGVSGASADVRVLLERSGKGDGAAQLALAMFTYEAAQAIARMAVALGGLDQLLFTGGIGEHAAEVRDGIAQQLSFLGVGGTSAGVDVRVVPAQEEQRMAEIVGELLTQER